MLAQRAWRTGVGAGRGAGQAAGRALSRREALAVGGLGGAAALIAACGRITTPVGASSATPTTAVAGSGGAGAGESWLYLDILTGRMLGKSGWPAYTPAQFTVPAHSTVHCEIRCFDDGPAQIPAGYERVQGTVGGTVSVLPVGTVTGLVGDLSSIQAKTVQAVDAQNVAHTLTVADIGLNVPVPPLSVVRFTLATGAAGAHGWQCMASCGTDQSGWGGPMATGGWMQGTMTVQG
jgi:hypothetical protein